MGSRNSRVPFFILGAQRSGTTLLRLMINRHPRLAVPHETAFMTVFNSKLTSYGDLAKPENARKLLDDIAGYHLVVRGKHVTNKDAILSHAITTYPELINAIMVEYAKSKGKERWGDKTPYYTPDIDVLWSLFPRSKFIHLVRDGRDVLVSQRKINWLSNSVPRLAEDWRWKTTVCHKVGSVLGPEYFLELKYEDLILDTAATLRTICEFLEEPFAEEMLTHDETAESVVPPTSLQWHESSVRRPDPQKLFAWRHELSKADQIIFEQVAGPALDLFGYERQNCRSTMASRLVARTWFLYDPANSKLTPAGTTSSPESILRRM